MKLASRPPLIPSERVISHSLVRACLALGLLYLFLVGVNGLGTGFRSLGSDLVESFFRATSNPFIGLMVGLLVTTLVQSSSVTTSTIVSLVGGSGLSIAYAVPMVMGANIGTTVTNTIVSMAHMGRKDEFRRAFSVATCHDFFNFMAVAVLLPLEITFHFMQTAAEWIASLLTGAVGGVTYSSPIKSGIKVGVAPVKWLTGVISDSGQVQAVLLIAISGVMIYVSLFLLVKIMRSLLQTKVEGAVAGVLGRSALLAMSVGVIVTAMVQSSSVTTSLLVPLAGAGIITLAQAFPVTIGANIGTTITALLASMAVTGNNAQAGVASAIVHLLFNLCGTALIYPVKRVRNIPLAAARKLADIAVRSRWWALAYVVFLFYILPGLLAYLNQDDGR